MLSVAAFVRLAKACLVVARRGRPSCNPGVVIAAVEYGDPPLPGRSV